MKKNLQSQFSSRQYMIGSEFEIFYYNTHSIKKVDWHTHPYYEFYFFLEGDATMYINDVSFKVKNGDILLMPPKVKHKIVVNNPEVPYRRFVFWLSKEYMAHLIAASKDYAYFENYVLSNNVYSFHNSSIEINEIQSRLIRLLSETKTDGFGKEARIPLLINELVLYLNTLIYEKNTNIQNNKEYSLYNAIANYIEDNISDNLSLDTLANQFYVSKFHIAHIFKENIGISIHQYITKKRLECCKKAIMSNNNISEVIDMYGFKDYSSFYRAFKKEYGMSPKEYQASRNSIHKILKDK